MTIMNSEGNFLVKCEVKDNSMNKLISDSSSQERLEVSDLVNIGENIETNSKSCPEIFTKLSNTPFNWDLTIYEKFRELCKESIREIYTQSDISSTETIENCYKSLLTPLRLLRFLLGFNFNLYNAHNTFNKHIQWRKEFNMDTVVRPYVITNMVPNNNIEMAPLHNIVTRYYPCNLLLRESTDEKTPLRDNFGNVICIERFGLLDETRLLGAVKVEELLLWYSYHMEYRSVLLDKLSYESKSLVRATCIMDLYGLSVSQVHSSHMITILRRMIQLASDNYPEGMSYVIFVNVPKFFSIVWNSFKALLAARTVEKILVLDDDYKTKLLTIIPISNLPQFLGGLTTDQYSSVPNTGTLLLDCFGLGDDRQTLHIKRMKKEKITISIIKPNTIIYWTWGVLEGEIGFSAKFIVDKIDKNEYKDYNLDQIINDDKFSIISATNIVNIDDNNVKLIFSSNESPNHDDSLDTEIKSDIKKNSNLTKKTIKNNIKYSNNQESNVIIPQSSSHEITIIPSSRFDSTKAYGGSYFVENPGYLTLQWDNSWSFFSGKTVHFVIKTSNSKLEEQNIIKDDIQNKTEIIDIPNISNLVSHNVALKTLTKKKPSKNHKSEDKKRNSKINKNTNKVTSIFNDNFLSNEDKTKNIKKDDIIKLSDKFNELNINQSEQILNLHINHDDFIENENFGTSSIFMEINSPNNNDQDSSIDSECQTNISFITANSNIQIINSSEYNQDLLINLNNPIDQLCENNKDYDLNKNSHEFINTQNELLENELSSINNNSNIHSTSLVDYDIIINNLSSTSNSSMDNYKETYSKEFKYTIDPEKREYIFFCKKSLETRIDIYGFDNFGIESSQINIKKQQELNNYLKNSNFEEKNINFKDNISFNNKESISWKKKLLKLFCKRSRSPNLLRSNSKYNLEFNNNKKKILINKIFNRFGNRNNL